MALPPFANSFTDHLGAWALVLAGIGTVSAVVVALYRDSWRAARRRPQLTLSFALPQGWDWTVVKGSRGDLLRIGLSVGNATGRDTANDVEVLLSVWWRMPDSAVQTPPDTQRQNFNQRPLLWADDYAVGTQRTRASIPPGVSRQLEFIRIGRPGDLQRVVDGEVPALDRLPELAGTSAVAQFRAFALFVAPPFRGTNAHLIQDHVIYHVRLVVTARDVDSIAYDSDVHVSARWDDDDHDECRVKLGADQAQLEKLRSPNAPVHA